MSAPKRRRKRSRSAAERYANAVHESGHTVAAMVLGRGVESVSIRATRASTGRTTLSAIASWTDRAIASDAVIALAGCIAERELLGRYALSFAHGDLEDALVSIDDLEQSDPLRALDLAVRSARNLVRANRKAIVALTERLLDVERMTGRAARRAVRACLVTKPPHRKRG